MRIYPLAIPTTEAARYHADIHLRSGVKAVTKILSDAVHFSVGKMGKPEFIKTPINVLGEQEYLFNCVKMRPPSGTVGVWSKWAAINQCNAWWLMDFAWQLNIELKRRFDLTDDLQDYLDTQDWVMAGIMKLFPRRLSAGEDKFKTLDDFPLILPPEEIIRMGNTQKMSVVDIYQNYYIAQKGKVRMKWTKTTPPPFSFQDDDIPV